jgi:hypothetical protein
VIVLVVAGIPANREGDASAGLMTVGRQSDCHAPAGLTALRMSEPAATEVRKKRNILLRIITWIGSLVTWLVLLIAVLWVCGALWFDFPQTIAPRPWSAASFAFVALLAAVLVRPRWCAKLGIAVAIVLAMIWWLSIQPRQYRDWKTEVALLPRARVDGEVVTFHNVRNFDYRTETDFTPRYEMRRLDLKNLRGVDIFINYWGPPYMAHPIMSYDFGPDGRICFSIETRPENGETYSAIGGFFRQYELCYIVADERDVIRLRTNFRQGGDTYLYRLNAKDPAKLRNSFLGYVRTINELVETPRWYNAITNNCTSAIRHQRTSSERAPWDWRMLVNGYGDEMLYERGGIGGSLPFAELKKLSHINSRAKAADDAADFSGKIREGLPGM